MIKKWNPAAVKNAVIDVLLDNSEAVSNFVETDARRRLLAISEPEWGAGYRQKIVAGLLMSKTERKANEVTITTGVATSKGSKHHGFYIELGSRRFPAHPFLRPAVFENGRKIVALLEGR